MSCELSEQERDIIRATTEFWGQRTGESVTREDAREILTNVTSFFELLHEWDRRARLENGHVQGSDGDDERT